MKNIKTVQALGRRCPLGSSIQTFISDAKAVMLEKRYLMSDVLAVDEELEALEEPSRSPMDSPRHNKAESPDASPNSDLESAYSENCTPTKLRRLIPTPSSV